MKKLMIGAMVVASAMVVSAVESANVVGYAKSDIRSGFTAAGAQFVPVSGTGIDLTDIKPTGYDKASYVGGSITIQILDASGKMVSGSQYSWYDDDDGTAWFDGNDDELAKGAVVLQPGEALWISGNAATEGIQSSGEVPATGVAVTLRSGFKLLCNPTPVSVNWNDAGDGKMIVASGYNKASYVGGSISAQQLTANGKMVSGSQYSWYDDDDGTGWFDGNDELVSGASLPAGAGIWVQANGTAESLVFPAAL